jgi:hypothetical protein
MVGRVALHMSAGDSQNRGKEQPGQERCIGHDARTLSEMAVWLQAAMNEPASASNWRDRTVKNMFLNVFFAHHNHSGGGAWI